MSDSTLPEDAKFLFTNNLLQTVTMLSEKGYLIFQLRLGMKIPFATTAPHGCKSATNDIEVVEQWWTAHSTCNIGVHCKGMVVLDVDNIAEFGDPFEGRSDFANVPSQTTPGVGKLLDANKKSIGDSPGRQYFFKKPEEKEWKNHTRKFACNIDIRTNGGYVVVAPSVIDGKSYQWVTPLPPIEELPEPPADVIARLDEICSAKPTKTDLPIHVQAINYLVTPTSEEKVIARASKYLESVDAAIQGQGGHAKLLWAASCLTHGFELDEATATKLLINSYNPRCQPSWNLSNPKDNADFQRKVRESIDKPLSNHPRGWLLNADHDFLLSEHTDIDISGIMTQVISSQKTKTPPKNGLIPMLRFQEYELPYPIDTDGNTAIQKISAVKLLDRIVNVDSVYMNAGVEIIPNEPLIVRQVLYLDVNGAYIVHVNHYAGEVEQPGVCGFGHFDTLQDALSNVYYNDQKLPCFRDLLAGYDTILKQLSFLEKEEPFVDDSFVPFPTHHLPDVLQYYVDGVVASVGCDASFVVNPLLVALATAIGSSRDVAPKSVDDEWREPCILWTLSVGESGEAKSPPFRMVQRFFRKADKEAREQFGNETQEYNRLYQIYERDKSNFKKGKTEEPPKESSAPRLVRYTLSDVTVEAVIDCLASNPRGCGIMRDELAGFLNSFGQYKKGDADSAFWLETYSGGIYSVDRKGGVKHTALDRCSVSINGTIQPTTLKRFIQDSGADENGMLYRFLVSCPPERGSKWTDAVVDKSVTAAVQKLFDSLIILQPTRDEFNHVCPMTIVFDDEAKQLFIEEFDRYGQEKVSLPPMQKSFWAKCPGRLARIALVLHCVKTASVTAQEWNPNAPWDLSWQTIDVGTMQSAIEITRWYANESARVYRRLGYVTTITDPFHELVFASIAKLKGKATQSNLERGNTKIKENFDKVELMVTDGLLTKTNKKGSGPKTFVYGLPNPGD